MATGKKPASLAGRGLRKKTTPKNQRTIDASDLAQRVPAPKKSTPVKKSTPAKKSTPVKKSTPAKKPTLKKPASKKH